MDESSIAGQAEKLRREIELMSKKSDATAITEAIH